MLALDLLGRRWTLRILWELRHGAMTFRALRDACEDVSPTVLNTRLKELQDNRIVEKTDTGYALTRSGERLSDPLMQLDRWAKGWAKESL
jgi:DNA-binding HxlR family transcriptional regulator